MKTQALVPALALAAALLASPLAEADSRHRSEARPPVLGSRRLRPPAEPRLATATARATATGRLRLPRYGYRPYYRSPRYYAPPPAYYGYGYGYGGYGYGGYDAYGYGYYPPPPPRATAAPRVGFGIWFGF